MSRERYFKIFREKYGNEPRAFRSPGRINVIGEHTDYNDGFVLPAAVDKEITFLMLPNYTGQFNLYSVDEEEAVSFNLSNYHQVGNEWAKYIIGVIDQLVKADYKIGSFDCVFGGNIPMGSGLSSSAALECAALYGINACFSLKLDKLEMVRMAQKAENDYVGVNCGIMDQFASVFSTKNHVLKIDCRDLSYKPYKIDLGDYDLMLVDSMVKHHHASSEYNLRREECERAVAVVAEVFPGTTSLRDTSPQMLEEVQDQLSTKEFMRASYIVAEIERVTQACQAIENQDLKALGNYLYQTHDGLQHRFEISCDELDFLVDFTREKEEILGARMMGGGFGGCTLNLIKSSYREQFGKEVSEAYLKEFDTKPNIYFVRTARGSSEIKQMELVDD